MQVLVHILSTKERKCNQIYAERSQSSLQAQNAVHLMSALTHLHLPLQPFSSLHPHFISSKQHLDASGRVVHSGCHVSQDVFFQPHSLGQGGVTDADKICPHMYPAKYAAPLVCCSSVAAVDWIASMLLPFLVN